MSAPPYARAAKPAGSSASPEETSPAARAVRRPATRADVARRAGVSTAVVSYVVNDGPRRVAPGTAARVREAIAALSYSPNVAARALRKGTTEMIGLVVPDITNPFFAELAREVELAAARHGLLVTLCSSNAHEELERELVDDLVERGMDGLVLSTVLPPRTFAALPRPRRPIVLLNVSSAFPGYTAIGSDARQGAYDVVDHLIAVHGHSSVVLIIGESTERLPEPREQGFSAAFAAHGLPPGPVVRTVFSRSGGYEAAQTVLRWRHRPTALFLSSDQQAAGAYRALREAGLECPDDVALVAYDGTAQAEYGWPPLTVSRQPVAAMARAAVEAILDPGSGPDYHQLATELVLRRSCGCPGTAPSTPPEPW